MNEPKDLHLSFSARTLDAICTALAARPWIEANAILQDIAAQVDAQQKDKATADTLPVLTDAVQ